MREEQRAGGDYLATATTLLQRIRSDHPTAGMYEAADLQWWWRSPRSTDTMPQLFWFDDAGPVAAAIAIDWAGQIALDVLVLPGTDPSMIAAIVDRGLEHCATWGFERVSVEVSRSDDHRRGVLADLGFVIDEPGFVEAWLDAVDRPEASPLADGYRLVTRADVLDRPHHMVERSGPDVEIRLRQTSLYRHDLDLIVLGPDAAPVAYGLFWHDPVTGTGMVEPMRTEDEHQRRGLARHVLTVGLGRLATAGAERVKICFEPDNPAASHLYRSVGFVPVDETDILAGPTRTVGRGVARAREITRE